MKIFLQILIAAGLVWIFSEMLELVMGGHPVPNGALLVTAG